ncbi:MAG: CopG family transcriptional regulator [Gammaproteobacteria bacterium]
MTKYMAQFTVAIMPALTKTTLYLPEAEYRLLEVLARQQHRPAAELVREAIIEYAGRHGKRHIPKSLGIGHSGRRDLSEKAEELLSGLEGGD